MIRTSYNDIIAKIFFEGKEIQKVYKQGIQVFPDAGFQKYFWMKVFDEDDQKTYYYHCTQTNVVYQEGSTEIIKEIHYTAGQKQENSPGENQQIYELVNDQVKITGNEYSENDFESFVDKSPNEVIAMMPKYQEKLKDLVNIKLGLVRQDEIFTENGAITYQTLQKQDIINNGKGFENLSEVPDDYIFNYSDYTSDKDYKFYQIIFKNVTNIQQNFYFITTGQYETFTWSSTYVTENINDFSNYTNYRSSPDTSGNGWTVNKGQKRGILYKVLIPVNSYISIYITLKVKGAGETFYNTFCYKENSFSIIDGNFLNHKYISDTTQEKQTGKFKYNFAFAMIKNDLSKKVFQTNCKYIISKEELTGINVNNVLQIPEYSLGWKLLTNAEFKTYSPKNSKYKFVLTVSNFKYTGDEFFGLLDKSGDYTNDFRIFGAGSTDVYFDPGSNRTSYIRNFTNTTPVTFIINGGTNTFEAWENGKKTHNWNYSTLNCGGFTDNNTGLYLNAYSYENNLTNEKFWFHEFKIVDVDSGEIIKRFVPSDDRTKLWECVSGKYIEPCRTVSDNNLPVIIDNLKLGVETKDGLGNKIEDWVIY